MADYHKNEPPKKKQKTDMIDVVEKKFKCDLCDFKFKKKGNLKQHKANVHDIGVVWHHCDLCDYKCKMNSSLKRHKADVHDIGGSLSGNG